MRVEVRVFTPPPPSTPPHPPPPPPHTPHPHPPTHRPSLPSSRSQFEIDFVALSFCNSAEDLYNTRALLDSLGMAQTKIVAKAGGHCVLVHGWVGGWGGGGEEGPCSPGQTKADDAP
jgi:hypothetical protein